MKTRLDLVRSSRSDTSPSLATVCKLSFHTICIVLSCCSCAIHHSSWSLVIWMYPFIIVCTIATRLFESCTQFLCPGAESAGRKRLDSKLSCELYLRRSRVPMEVERCAVRGMLRCQTIGIVVMSPLGGGRGDETVFVHLRRRAVVIIHTVTHTHTCKRALGPTRTDVVV